MPDAIERGGNVAVTHRVDERKRLARMRMLERERTRRRGRHALFRQDEHRGGDERGTEVQKTAASAQGLRGHRNSIRIWKDRRDCRRSRPETQRFPPGGERRWTDAPNDDGAQPGLRSADGLRVKIAERALRVVPFLECAVRVAVVDGPELVLGEIRLGVQRLDPAERVDLALDLAVEMPRRMRRAVAHDVPEPEVDVQRVGFERIKRKALARRRRPDRAGPYRQDADLGVEELEKLGGALERNVDVLDHRLGM